MLLSLSIYADICMYCRYFDSFFAIDFWIWTCCFSAIEPNNYFLQSLPLLRTIFIIFLIVDIMFAFLPLIFGSGHVGLRSEIDLLWEGEIKEILKVVLCWMVVFRWLEGWKRFWGGRM